MRAALFAFASTALLLVACGSASESPSDGDSSQDEVIAAGVGGMKAAPSDACTAEFVFLQKDAYKTTPGHANPLWPAHTTTQLKVTCQTKNGAQTIEPFMENHGTKPGTKDAASGKDMLDAIDVDTSLTTVEAPWSQMQKLVAGYGECECQADTFVSLDHIDQDAAPMLQTIMPILTCKDAPEAFMGALQARDFDKVKTMLLGCRVKEGVSADELAKTAATVEEQAKKAFAGKHLCNNDAELQMDQFKHFRETKEVKACDAHDKTYCAFPKIFYLPAKETK